MTMTVDLNAQRLNQSRTMADKQICEKEYSPMTQTTTATDTLTTAPRNTDIRASAMSPFPAPAMKQPSSQTT
jgi:hypothetical protein